MARRKYRRTPRHNWLAIGLGIAVFLISIESVEVRFAWHRAHVSVPNVLQALYVLVNPKHWINWQLF